MGLTTGTGPFSPRRAGVFNFDVEAPAHVLYFDDSPRRVRARFGGETIVDSTRAKLLFETGHLPVYYLPRDDVRMDLLRPTEHATHCPFKGDATYWSIEVDGKVAENAAWAYPQPIDGAPPLAEYVAFYWGSPDEWLEEDERVFVHPRDPYHRVDVLESSRHVRIALDGELLAESSRPLILFETGLPPRYYLDREDVREELLEPATRETACPYKGTARYWSARVGERVEEALVWSYEQPLRDVEPIAGRLCFFNERVDVEVDGVAQERPVTQWSQGDPDAHGR